MNYCAIYNKYDGHCAYCGKKIEFLTHKGYDYFDDMQNRISSSAYPQAHDTILPYVELVEEALCFGWIDSTLHSNPDGEGVFQRISPRRKNSHWTELNIERCKKMIAAGRMTEAGLKVMPTENTK